MQTKTYVLFPSGSSVENTQRVWAARARLAHEGKDLELKNCNICFTPTCSDLHTPAEIIVLAYEGWDKDLNIQNAIHLASTAQNTSHCIRLLNPYSWKELPLTQKVISRRKNVQKTKPKQKISQKISHETFA